MNINNFGILYIVATPIGNLGDMSFRAVEILKTVASIAAEDTRHSKSLLQHFQIETSLFSLHEHNEKERSKFLIERLKSGESIALISDAGTPLISDPGYFLVQEARNAGITVIPIPGPCAAITALSASGLPTDRFSFIGFLPAKSSQRKEKLKKLSEERNTLIFYETPHRILECLRDMKIVFGAERYGVIARELTKLHETIHGDLLGSLIEWVEQDANQQRGEIVLMVAGSAHQETEDVTLSVHHLLQTLLLEFPLKQAVELAAKLSGKRKNEIYQQALQLK